MSSLKLDRHLETKAKDELQEDLVAEQKRQSPRCCSSSASS